MREVHRLALLFLCLPAMCMSGCEVATPPPARGSGPGHRQQQLALSSQQELALGRQSFREILSDPENFGRPLPSDHPESRRVRDVAVRIVKAAGIEPLQREINLRAGYRFEWEVVVFENEQINAFCLPGGKIGVFTGLLRVSQNDGQLATAMSHEIAHALAHHTSERLARGELNQTGFGRIWSRAFDRQEESEADHIGVFLMTFAGYNPDEALRFWEGMQQASAGRARLPEILSDHPSDERRIHDLAAWIPQAKAAKHAFDEGRIAPPHR
jgi:predicted Zn-dependent protease